jgi:hypothetical protein
MSALRGQSGHAANIFRGPNLTLAVLCMLDVVVEGIAIPDAFKRQPGSKRNEFRQTRMRRPKPVLDISGEERALPLGRVT